ncbi:hypothetical protein D3C85_1884730 [compost metagenome]
MLRFKLSHLGIDQGDISPLLLVIIEGITEIHLAKMLAAGMQDVFGLAAFEEIQIIAQML